MDIDSGTTLPTIHRAGPRDLIAHVWFQLGHRPRDSLVLIALDGDRLRAGPMTRCALDAGEDMGGLVDAALAPLLRAVPLPMVLAIVDSPLLGDVVPSPPGSWGTRLTRALTYALRREGVDCLDVLGVGTDVYASLLHPEAGSRPLSDVLASNAAAVSVAAGLPLLPDREALAADVDADVDAGVDAGADTGADEEAGEQDAAPGAGGAPRGVAVVSAALWLSRWRAELERAEPEAGEGRREWAPDRVRGFGAALSDAWLRDAVLWAVGGDALLPELVLFGADQEEERSRRTDEVLGRRPDPGRAERARLLLARVARACPGPDGAEAVALLAWLAWWQGDGVRSRVLAERAERRSPGHRLTLLLGRILDSGMPPGWVTRAEPDILG